MPVGMFLFRFFKKILKKVLTNEISCVKLTDEKLAMTNFIFYI